MISINLMKEYILEKINLENYVLEIDKEKILDKLEKTLSILVEDAPNTYVEFTSARYKEFVNEIKMILTEECLREQLRKMDKTVDGKFKNIQNINLQKQIQICEDFAVNATMQHQLITKKKNDNTLIICLESKINF